ncbi:Dyp-type peroxidase [Kitasatospora sp. NPDC057198]|uniref:Dyp-type peroxidase n=1 Tax=Kitasatospora sp. NPDC057198 TaxID=3346046 RepID=UPI0036411C2D
MPNDLSLRQSTEIQGDVLAGFKKDNLRLLLVNFGNRAAARTWLEKTAPEIATTRRVAEFNAKFSRARDTSGGDDPQTLRATWLGLGFTCAGLRFLTGRKDLLAAQAQGADDDTLKAFVEGPGDPRRALDLGDTDDSDPAHWVFGSANRPTVHAVLTIASDTAEGLEAEVTRQRLAVSAADAVVVFEQEGVALPGDAAGKEHFGFADGVSQPGVVGFDEEDPARPGYVKGKPGTRLIPAGELVVGHRAGSRHNPKTAATEKVPAWMKDGSFQVVRRLEQDVPGWWAQVDSQLRRLKDVKAVPFDTTREWFAARLVGRWRDGTPIATCPNKPAPAPGTVPGNDISYREDPDGLRTPLFSHLRKTNPRDGLVGEDGNLVDEEFMDVRRIMRRGAPYGQPFDPMSNDPAKGPDAERGLTFVCYQADLVGQFEFIQKKWINNPDFPPNRPAKPGPDPMVSGKLTNVVDGKISFESRNPAGDRQTAELDFQPFVRTRGALYTFVPSISTLHRLAQGDLDSQQSGTGQEQGSTRPAPGQNLPVDAVLPLPDRADSYWTFQQGTIRLVHTDGEDVTALTTGDVDDRTGLVTETVGPYSSWPALAGVTQIDAILPVPDEQRVNGTSTYWLFHTKNGGQVYRRISIADAAPYTNGSPADDKPLDRWKSLGAGTRVDAFLPMPERQPHTDGRYWYWAFHTTDLGQRHRVVSIGSRGDEHPDRQERDDRKLAAWESLHGISRVEAFLPVPGKEDSRGQQWFWVFHQDRFRVVTILRRDDHDDEERRADRPTAPWSRPRTR